MKNKVLLVSVLALSLFVLSVIGFMGYNAVFADENTTYPPIIQKLVERFGLDPAEVQKVFTEEQEEMKIQGEQNFQQSFEERLQTAVDNGKITEAQKSAIIAKQTEIREKQEALKNLSADERKEAMNSLREEMENWAEENGIEDGFCMSFFRGPGGFNGEHKGHGMGHGMGNDFTPPEPNSEE